MKIEIIIKKTKELTNSEMKIMNNARIKEWDKKSRVDFKKEDSKGQFFFVKEKNKIKAFSMIKPIKIKLANSKFEIMGLGRFISLEKKKGWGRILSSALIFYLKKTKMTAVGFTDRKNIETLKKMGYQIQKNGIRRFRYLNPKTKKLISDNDGDIIYYEGKDNFITKLLKSKKLAITDTDFW